MEMDYTRVWICNSKALGDAITNSNDSGEWIHCKGRIICFTPSIILDISSTDKREAINFIKSVTYLECPLAIGPNSKLDIADFQTLVNWDAKGDVIIEGTNLETIEFKALKEFTGNRLRIVNNKKLTKITWPTDAQIRFQHIEVCGNPLEENTVEMFQKLKNYESCKGKGSVFGTIAIILGSIGAFSLLGVAILYRDLIFQAVVVIINRARSEEAPATALQPIPELVVLYDPIVSVVSHQTVVPEESQPLSIPSQLSDPSSISPRPNSATSQTPLLHLSSSATSPIGSIAISEYGDIFPEYSKLASTSSILTRDFPASSLPTPPSEQDRIPTSSSIFSNYADTPRILPRNILASCRESGRRPSIFPLSRLIDFNSAPGSLPNRPELLQIEAGPSSPSVSDPVPTEFDYNSLEIMQLLGAGAFGECYLVRNEFIGVAVAKIFVGEERQEDIENEEYYDDAELEGLAVLETGGEAGTVEEEKFARQSKIDENWTEDRKDEEMTRKNQEISLDREKVEMFQGPSRFETEVEIANEEESSRSPEKERIVEEIASRPLELDERQQGEKQEESDEKEAPGGIEEYRGPSRQELMQREVDLAMLLKGHKHVVHFYGTIFYGLPNQIIGFLMEPLTGGDLHDYVCNNDGEVKLLNTWTLHIAKAIAFLQRNIIIHRDIKPENILLTGDLRVAKLADFGYAKRKVAGTRNTMRITNLMYAAPDLYLDDAYTIKADVYSFGVTLYFMYYRRLPYNRNLDLFAVKTAQWLRNNATRPPLEGKPVDGLISSCWDGEPSNRPTIRSVLRDHLESSKGRARFPRYNY